MSEQADLVESTDTLELLLLEPTEHYRPRGCPLCGSLTLRVTNVRQIGVLRDHMPGAHASVPLYTVEWRCDGCEGPVTKQ